ncbi:hypothetical protein LCGC14_1396480 [marine sediment metagenome]|uniref:Uncharacterized protein n=1 Tax=marine sediment metagenome TaxID=412755 RepID=A0A0F9N003_9ZZZZ
MAAILENTAFSGYNTDTWNLTISSSLDRWIVVFASRAIDSGASPPTGVTFDGNAMTQLGSDETSEDINIEVSSNVWYYQVPAGTAAGSKEIIVSGGNNTGVHHAIEVSQARSLNPTPQYTDGGDANLTISAVEAGSLCLDQVVSDVAATPTTDEGNTSWDSGNFDGAGSNFDYGWGASSEAAPAGGGDVTMGWSPGSSNRSYWMIEVFGKFAPHQIIVAV